MAPPNGTAVAQNQLRAPGCLLTYSTRSGQGLADCGYLGNSIHSRKSTEMRTLFTIHAGEYLVGELIADRFKNLDIWVPAKDTGVDLLVTGKECNARLKLQVKFSRTYEPSKAVSDFDKSHVAGGWLTISPGQLADSAADLWIIVLDQRVGDDWKRQFIVVPRHVLLEKLKAVHGKSSKKYQFYPTILSTGTCLDARGLSADAKDRIAKGTFPSDERSRDLTPYLNNWEPLERLAKFD